MVGGNKEIVYNNIERFAVVIAVDKYRGMTYICVNRGMHPCAYVICPKDFLDKYYNPDEGIIPGIKVHGGIDYVGEVNELLGLEDYEGYCIGWDYGHAGDWTGKLSNEENIAYGHKKYTTKILVDDCKKVIDQYYQILDDERVDFNDESQLTHKILSHCGFKSVFGNGPDSEDALQLSGDENGNRWKIYIDLKKPTNTFIITQNPRMKYEGPILTVKDMKLAIKLFKLPLKCPKTNCSK